MNEPTKIKVGYRDIEIKWLYPDFKTEELIDCFGQYKQREGLIEIQRDLYGQKMINTLLHQITNYFLAICRDNPWFLDYIKDNMNKNA